MTIVPISCLSASDLAILGNNLRPAARKHRPRLSSQEVLAAVNRSLAVVDEEVTRLHRGGVSLAGSAKRSAAAVQ